VAILGLHLEANAFAPPTVREDFLRQCWEEGEAISRLARQVSQLPSELPGFYARMDATGEWTPVPILVASAPPGGPIVQALFLEICDRIRIGLAAALPVDAVYVPSHGASSATGDEDSDGTLVATVREIVGPAVPIVVSHDLHCNVSERLVEACDALVVYRTNPHVDQRERAAESADLLREMLAGMRTARVFIRLPLTPPTVTLLTAEGPYADLIRMGQELTGGAVANVSVAGGFVYSDLPKCGVSVTVTARADPRDKSPGAGVAAARRVALAIARRGWAERGRHTRRLLSPDEAVALARRAAEGATKPVIFSDSADNPGGGGRGNTTWLMAALHAAKVSGVVLGVFVDPGVAAEAHAAGEGAHIHAVFNRVESAFSKRLEVGATVEKLTDGRGRPARRLRRQAVQSRAFGAAAPGRVRHAGRCRQPAPATRRADDAGDAWHRHCRGEMRRGEEPRPFPRRVRRILCAGTDVRGGHAGPDQSDPGQFRLEAAAASGFPARSGHALAGTGVGVIGAPAGLLRGRPV